MSHGKALSTAVNEWVRAQMLAWLEGKPGRTRAELARLLSVSSAHVTNIPKNGHGVGAGIEEAMGHLLGIGVDELRRRAQEEWKGGEAVETVPEDRYPNRAAAVAFMAPQVRPEALQRVQSVQLQSDHDPDAKWWADQIEAADRLIRMEALDLAGTAASAKEKADAARGSDLERATAPRRRGRRSS